MQKLVLFFLLVSGSLFSQANKGTCKVAKPVPDPIAKSKITFKFVNPVGGPVCSRLAFKINNDTIIQPKIDKTGTYVMTFEPGTYSFSFFVKYWYDIHSKPIVLKPKTNTIVTVKFEAEEIGVK